MSNEDQDDALGTVHRRLLHIIWLLDCTSDITGTRCQTLNNAMRNFIDSCRVLGESVLFQPRIGVIAFGSEAYWHIPIATPLEGLQWQELHASGGFSLGSALNLLADGLDESWERFKFITRPVLILVSDARPTDDWRSRVNEFNESRWGKEGLTLRIGVVLCRDVDDTLSAFTGESDLVVAAKSPSSLLAIVDWIGRFVEDAYTPRGLGGYVGTLRMKGDGLQEQLKRVPPPVPRGTDRDDR